MEKRSDDNETALRSRLAGYHAYTADVLKFYSTKGVLTVLDAARSKDFVAKEIASALKQ